MKILLQIVLLFSLPLGAFESISLKDKKELGKYKFVLVMPSNVGHSCAVFSLDDLRICRFPNGPMWSNSVKSQKLYSISQDAYRQISNKAKKLPVLCIDEGRIHGHNISRSNKDVCGFALPWEQGMAYVFDDLKDVDQVCGLIVENDFLQRLDLEAEGAKPEFELLDDDEDFDMVDALVSDNDDDDFDAKALPYPLEGIKNYFGRIFIACLLNYHGLRSKLIWLLRPRDQR